MVEGTFHILMDDFDIGQSCACLRVPVDNEFAAINPAFFIEFYENLADRFRQSFIKGETFPRIINRNSHLAPLLLDGCRILILPFPDLIQEFLPTKVITGNAIFSQASFYLGLCGNTSVIHPRQPERVKTLHTLLTDNYILQSRVPSVTKVQFPRHIRRWNHDRVRVRFFIA